MTRWLVGRPLILKSAVSPDFAASGTLAGMSVNHETPEAHEQ
jgi:hypothetical protein